MFLDKFLDLFTNRNPAKTAPRRGVSLSSRRTLDRLKEASLSFYSVEKELMSNPDKDNLPRTKNLLAVGGVLKIIADTFNDNILTADPSSQNQVARDCLSLYRRILKLVEDARRDMANPSPRVEPVYMDDITGINIPSEKSLFLLKDTIDALKEALYDDMSNDKNKLLSDYLAQIQSRMNVVLITGDVKPSDSSSGDEDFLSVVESCDEIFNLWVLSAQEHVNPGITEPLLVHSGDFDPNDVWLMTDPVSRARYEDEGNLKALERDIRFETMRNEPWQKTDIEYLKQIKLFEARKKVRKMASFWCVSPHPPIYRALGNGAFRIGSRRYPFRKGQNIVWACRMTRDMANLDGPVLIGDFRSTRIRQLCGQMSNAMMGRGMNPAGQMRM